jgi:hypothetical protein
MISIWNSDVRSVQNLYPKKGKLVHSQNIISYITSTEKCKGLNKEKNLSSTKEFRKVNANNIKIENNIEVEIHQQIIGN